MSGRKVVVTGSSGFVGSQLVKVLVQQHYEVLSLDSSSPQEMPPSIECLGIDLNEISLGDLVALVKDAVIVHLAAFSTSSKCEAEKANAIDANLKATSKIIEAANAAKSKLIFASSEWVFPDSSKIVEYSSDQEPSLRADTNFYAMTKIVGEWMVRRYSSNYLILRFGIIYGERLNVQSAVENIVHCAVNFKTLRLGNLNTSRRFIHVLDICSGIIRCIEEIDKVGNRIFHLSGEKLISLNEIIKITEFLFGEEISKIVDESVASIRDLSPQSFYDFFDWKPAVSIESGVTKLITWEKIRRDPL